MSDVDVCATESPLVHVTVVPTATVRSSGANARLPSVDAPDGIVTDDEAAPVAGCVDGDGAASDDESELPHAIVKIKTVETTAKRIDNIRTSARYDASQRTAFHHIEDCRNTKRRTILESDCGCRISSRR
ncbi:MAG TPA: hypothetical protein VKE51_34105 [Vicinamibacterales bacterium]|nr:hypothetical protein [Vicinamibacterales bacterium]